MRFAYAAIVALVAAVFLPYSAAAAQISYGSDVSAARVAAEQELISLGINPADAVFQIGARNYAGPDCPGAGWNCTTAKVVVQIGTNIISSTSSAQCSSNGTPITPSNPCTIIQPGPGSNIARCVQHSNETPAIQSCSITQTSTGTNSAFVDQRISQSQADSAGFQSGKQLALVSQSNTTGTNTSVIAQTINQLQTKYISGLTDANQHQEAHQNIFVCQGGGTNTCSVTTANPRNLSGVFQTTIQNEKVLFGANSSGAVTQNQNTDTSGCFPTTCAVSSAVVRQNSSSKRNDAGFLNFSRPTASVRSANDNDGDEDDDQGDEDDSVNAGFAGSVLQQQGNGLGCPNGGLCGFEFQNSNSAQAAFERQDELQRAIAPLNLSSNCPAGSGQVCQVQHGGEFCCATQRNANGLTPANAGSINNVTLRKVQRHTSTFADATAQGHCSSPSGGTPDDNCTVDVTVNQQGSPPQNNHCTGGSCNVVIACEQGSVGPSGPLGPTPQATTGTCPVNGNADGTPLPPPLPECAFGCLLLRSSEIQLPLEEWSTI